MDLKERLVTLLCRLLSLVFPRPRPAHPPPSSILIIKPCCIGDVLMASAALAQLRAAFPRARIAFAVGPWSREVLAHNPRVDELLDCATLGSGARTSPRDYLSFLLEIRRQGFDICLVLDRSPLLTLLPFLAGIPHRLGLDSQGRGFSLTVRVPCPPHRHEVELYLDVVRALGVTPQSPRLELFPSAQDEAWAEAALAPLREGPGLTVALHPGGGINPGMSLLAKQWPPSGFAQVAQRLIERGAKVVVVGAAWEEGAAQKIKAALNGASASFLNLVGQTTLGQLGALLSRCQLFIGGDSGPLHLAVAVGTPVVALFGPSSPANYAPYSLRSAVIYRGIPCSPCFVKGRAPTSCPENRCLTSVTPEEVLREAEILLARLGQGF